MLKWLQRDLEANKQDWLVAYCHHPPYTKGSHDSDNDRDSDARMRMMRERILPILEAYGLDLMLTGTVILTNGRISPTDTTAFPKRWIPRRTSRAWRTDARTARAPM